MLTRRDVLRGLGATTLAGAMAPGSAWADRLRILDPGRAAPPPAEASPELQRLAATLVPGESRLRGALAVVWLHADGLAPALDLATLEEASAAGALVITERPQATVPDLVADNRGKRPVLLLAGEILLGGKQNRVLAEDLLLPAGSGPRSIGVYCVEAGRWSGASGRFESRGTFAPPALRSQVLDRADQQRVWGVVSSFAESTAAPSSTQNFQAVVEQPEVKAHVKRVADDLDRPPAGALGAAAFAGSRPLGLDVFQSPALFARLWPKLLRAHAVETYRTVETDGDAGAREAGLRGLLAALRHARGASRRNAGDGLLFEFRAEALRGAALAWRDQLIHLAVV